MPLRWDDTSADETGFEVLRRQLGTSEWRSVKILGRDVTTLDDVALSPGKSFVYRVHAVNDHGASLGSNEVRAW